MKNGYYWINFSGKGIIARWDGAVWHHENGTSPWQEVKVIPHSLWQGFRKWIGLSIQPLGGGCPLGCRCTDNGDGTINVNCS